MILNVSGRSDIVAFYSEWFMNRYNEGFVDVRNPIYPKLVSRIYFKDVDAIVFCSKNPLPIIDKLPLLDKPIIFHVTLTCYGKDIEPNVIDKNLVIEGIKKISTIIGKDRVYLRYDPILINNKYTIDYHIKAFNKLTALLDGYVEHIIISFIDDYKNVRKNKDILNIKELNENDYKLIGENFSRIASEHNMSIQTCNELNTLFEYGFIKDDCISKTLAYKLTGKKYKKWNARGKLCECVEMSDIGYYNTCKHFCKYCYANYDEDQVINNFKLHNPKSSLLIGELKSDDIIKIKTSNVSL